MSTIVIGVCIRLGLASEYDCDWCLHRTGIGVRVRLGLVSGMPE